MNKIETLKAEIKAIEADLPQDTTADDYHKRLYEILVVAFFKAKDIIELYDDVNPVIEEPVDDGALVAANLIISDQGLEIEECKKVILELSTKLTNILAIVV